MNRKVQDYPSGREWHILRIFFSLKLGEGSVAIKRSKRRSGAAIMLSGETNLITLSDTVSHRVKMKNALWPLPKIGGLGISFATLPALSFKWIMTEGSQNALPVANNYAHSVLNDEKRRAI